MIATRYTPDMKPAWDKFVGDSKNATFLFYRDYMNYHADRFTDCSLLIHEGDELTALFPATIKDGVVTSHGGLTYGGVLASRRMTARRMLDIFDLIKQYYAKLPATRIIYKPIPSIYTSVPAAEDLYALFIHEARLIRRDISSAIFLPDRIPFAKGSRYNLSLAKKAGLEVRKTEDYQSFWHVVTEALQAHEAKPVHSVEEITALAAAFPKHIGLHGAFLGDDMLAGIVTYTNRRTAHAQYMGAGAKGRTSGALPAIVAHLLGNTLTDIDYFDFGISTENQGRYLNEGLIAQKEMFGGRAVMYDHYEILL